MTRRRRHAQGRPDPGPRTSCRSRRLVRTRPEPRPGRRLPCSARLQRRAGTPTRPARRHPRRPVVPLVASQPAAGAISPRPRCSTATQKALRTARATSPAPIESRYARRESSMLSAYSPTRYVAMARRSMSSTPSDASRSAANRRSRASAHAWRSYAALPRFRAACGAVERCGICLVSTTETASGYPIPVVDHAVTIHRSRRRSRPCRRRSCRTSSCR